MHNIQEKIGNVIREIKTIKIKKEILKIIMNILENQNVVYELISRFDKAEKRFTEIENRSIETS